MKKISSLSVFVGAALIALAPVASAQYSGTLVIDAASPTVPGSTYQTFQACATDLSAVGVSGPVTILVLPSASPYAGFSQPAIPGTSATNTVTYTPASGPGTVTLSGPAAGFVQTVRLGTATSVTTASVGTGPSYLVFDGFEVTGAPSGAGIVAFGASFVTIRNCVVHTCGSGIGLSITNDSVVEDNEVYGVAMTPGAGGSALYSGGIWAYYLSARNLIQRNRVHDCAAIGIFLGSSGSTTATPDNTVINNFIWNVGTNTGSTTYAGGMAFRRATNSLIAHNSVLMPASSNLPGVFLMGGSTTAPLVVSTFANNIVRHEGLRACVQAEYPNAAEFPALLDNNLYDAAGGGPIGATGTSPTVPTVTHATLASWQGVTTKEAASVAGLAGFIAPNDLHIIPSSAAFNAGVALAAVQFDIDNNPRPLGGAPDIGADEVPASGLFAAFTANVVSGTAPLIVGFSDFSFSSAPGGITSWAWDFDGDGLVDSTLQNPTFTYNCPGTFNVTLMVTDGVNPANSLTRTGYISVGQFVFSLSTSGLGDLTVNPVPTTCGAAQGAVSGWTLVSFATPSPVGTAPFFGITPDATTFSFLFSAAVPGNPVHFQVFPGLYPNAGPFVLPAGSFPVGLGLQMDAVMVFLNGAGGLQYVSNVSRVAF